MRGVTFLGDRELQLLDFPDPTPGPHDVVLEMKSSGMCGSDLHQYRRPKGGGQATGLPMASQPVIAGHQGCTNCEHCRAGWQQLCQNVPVKVYGNNNNGGHAPYLLVPANTLVLLPDELSFETGAAIACGTGTAYGALRRINLSGNDTIAIFGQGPVGLSATQLAKAMGARVIALDISPERLDRATEFGADDVVNPGSNDPVAAIRDLTHGRGADLTLDTSASPAGRIAAVRAVKVWGTCCFVGEQGDVTINVSPDMLRRQVTIVASWTFSSIGQEECARFVVDRKVDVDKLFTHRWKLDQAEEAYRIFDRQTEGKGVFLM